MVVNIGLVGAGTVGSGFVKIFAKQKQFFKESLGLTIELKRIVDKNTSLFDTLPVQDVMLTSNIEDILNDPDIHLVIELIGGTTVAKTLILSALKLGKHVVTANKALLAEYGPEIFQAAEANNVSVFFEASVGGGTPVIKTIRESLIGNEIMTVNTIINGTCNYILTQMTEYGHDFESVLKKAQEAGYAESDPTLDISGGDTGHKVAIMASLLYGGYVPFNNIYIEGIQNIDVLDIHFAKNLGYTIKLLGIIKKSDNSGLDIRVHPAMLHANHILSSVSDVFNAVLIEGDAVGPILLYGKGAGEMPTASAVISDVIDAIRNMTVNSASRIPMNFYTTSNRLPVKPVQELTGRYYLRFSVVDKPKVLGPITMILGDHSISIASAIQEEQRAGDIVPFIIITHEAKEENLQNAIVEIEKLESVKRKTQVIRIEEE